MAVAHFLQEYTPLMFYKAIVLGQLGGGARWVSGGQGLAAPDARVGKARVVKARVGGEALLPTAPVPGGTLAMIDKGEVLPEDLAPLVYLQGKLRGFPDSRQLDHVVIDEAQDFSPFQVALLRELSLTDSFTILGDLSQGINADQGISNWDELMAVFPMGSCRYYSLEQSYRSTHEIITFANGIISQCWAPAALARPVFRSGASVRAERVEAEALPGAVV